MDYFPERRVSPLASWARRLAMFSLVLLATDIVGHRFALVESIAFLWTLGVVFVIALAAILLAAGGLSRLWEAGERAGRSSIMAAVLSGLVLVPYVMAGYAALVYPPLTDISTDLIDPPGLDQSARRRDAGMNSVQPISAESAELQARAYPQVTGRRYEAGMEQAIRAVWSVASDRGWTPHSVSMPVHDAVEQSFEWSAPSFILAIPTDAAVRLTDEGPTVFVDMRMSSRYGAHDFSLNARRIDGFLADLDRRISEQALEMGGDLSSDREEEPVE